MVIDLKIVSLSIQFQVASIITNQVVGANREKASYQDIMKNAACSILHFEVMNLNSMKLTYDLKLITCGYWFTNSGKQCFVIRS